MRLSLLPLASFAIAAPSLFPRSQSLSSAISSVFPEGSKITPQILETLLEPNEINIARNSYVYRDHTRLKLNGQIWTASGANVYWLGLDENVIPPAGAPFYAPFNASYPTKGRITEIMNTLVTMGARTIRSQTLGVSTGNPLSLMPTLGVYNEQAFDTIDWSVYQARRHGLRIVAPLTDNYVRFLFQ
jgi:mannan endo-1,4-beta-mannosidase